MRPHRHFANCQLRAGLTAIATHVALTRLGVVLSPIGVVTLCCLTLVTLGHVAEVAHEAGLVRAVHVLAYIKIVKIAQNLFANSRLSYRDLFGGQPSTTSP